MPAPDADAAHDRAASLALPPGVIALTGGIGSGKSSVGRLLAGGGAVVVDADDLARTVLEPGTPGFAAVVAAFGQELVQGDGTIDRARLADLVFADPPLREQLEHIVHPLVQRAARDRFEEAPADAVLIYELPLLVETGNHDQFLAVIVVDAAAEVRLIRLMARGLTEADARRRMAAQASREARLEIADEVIDNSGSLADLETSVPSLLSRLRRLR